MTLLGCRQVLAKFMSMHRFLGGCSSDSRMWVEGGMGGNPTAWLTEMHWREWGWDWNRACLWICLVSNHFFPPDNAGDDEVDDDGGGGCQLVSFNGMFVVYYICTTSRRVGIVHFNHWIAIQSFSLLLLSGARLLILLQFMLRANIQNNDSQTNDQAKSTQK